MRKTNGSKIIIICCLIVAIGCFSMYFILAPKYNLNAIKEETVGDISFIYTNKIVYIKDAIPTLDKFGVLNEGFSFTIKNNSSSTKNYTLILSGNDSTIKNNDIRYELTKNSDVYEISSLRDDGVIDIGEIHANEEIKYLIKLWLNYDSEYIKGSFYKNISVIEGINENTKIEKPVLVEGMIPVYYDYDNNTWYKADSNDRKWYDYNEQKWANVVTVKNDKRKHYQESDTGTKILLEDINSAWVWIPRFNYSLDNNDIIVNFVNINEEAYQAFSFDDQELSGFWIAKYEASKQKDGLYFIPNSLSTNKMTMASLFYTIRKMEFKGNIYGFTSAGNKLYNDGVIKDDNNNLDIHMIKNSEWQAVALLSDSKYGKWGNKDYKEKIITNNNSNYTGQSFYQDNTYEYNIKIKGESASTTGNVTGVYDMAGGKREYTMINNSNINLFRSKSNSGFNTMIKYCYYDDGFKNDTTLQFQDRYGGENNVGDNPITRGGYMNTGNIFSVYSANDFTNKISLESNTRASIVIIKEIKNEET